jgi:Holliday junction resolvasome RuvABC endonuclease subunit
MAKRLMGIRNKVNELINKFNIEKVILEDIQLQNNVSSNVVTYKTLAEVIGVITELCAELKLPYELIHSSSWKSSLNIKGRTRPE